MSVLRCDWCERERGKGSVATRVGSARTAILRMQRSSRSRSAGSSKCSKYWWLSTWRSLRPKALSFAPIRKCLCMSVAATNRSMSVRMDLRVFSSRSSNTP